MSAVFLAKVEVKEQQETKQLKPGDEKVTAKGQRGGSGVIDVSASDVGEHLMMD